MALPIGASALIAAGPLLQGIGGVMQAGRTAKGLERNATAIEAQGTRDAGQERRRGERVLGDTRAAQAFSGGAMDAGAIERLARIHAETDINVDAIMGGATAKADGMRKQAKSLRQSAILNLFGQGLSAAGGIAGQST